MIVCGFSVGRRTWLRYDPGLQDMYKLGTRLRGKESKEIVNDERVESAGLVV